MEHDPYQNPEYEEENAVEVEEPTAERPRDTTKLPATEPKFEKVDATDDERTMAALAHGSAILTAFSGGVGLVVPVVVWAVHRDKSSWVADQSLQALIFQVAATLIAYVLGLLAAASIAVSSALIVVLIGLCLFPLALILGLVAVVFPFAAVAYALFGALETYQGRDFEYRWVADLIEERS